MFPLNLCNNRDQTWFCHSLTFARSLGFQHLPWDLANVNEWKIMFDPYILWHIRSPLIQLIVTSISYHKSLVYPKHTITVNVEISILAVHNHISCDAHQAIPYTMRCLPGHIISHARSIQAIPLYHVMPARPYYIPCESARSYHTPCDACQAVLYTITCLLGQTIYHTMRARPYHTI